MDNPVVGWTPAPAGGRQLSRFTLGGILTWPSETIMAAIVGAALSSAATAILSTWLLKRNEREATRLQLATELTAAVHEHLANLAELVASMLREDDAHTSHRSACMTAFLRSEGKIASLHLRAWQLFRQRRVRAAITKMRGRFHLLKDYLANTKDFSGLDEAVDWANEQANEALDFVSMASGVSKKDKSRIIFIGFRKVTPEDKRLLSFEDETPPWKRAAEPNAP